MPVVSFSPQEIREQRAAGANGKQGGPFRRSSRAPEKVQNQITPRRMLIRNHGGNVISLQSLENGAHGGRQGDDVYVHFPAKSNEQIIYELIGLCPDEKICRVTAGSHP